MLYNELIAEVIKRVERSKAAIKADYELTFQEQLAIWLEDFEEDIVISYVGLNPTMTEESLADVEFEKKLDEELRNAAVWKGSWVD